MAQSRYADCQTNQKSVETPFPRCFHRNDAISQEVQKCFLMIIFSHRNGGFQIDARRSKMRGSGLGKGTDIVVDMMGSAAAVESAAVV